MMKGDRVRMLGKGAAFAVLALALAGCSAVTGGGPAPATYDLSAASGFNTSGRSGAHVVVMGPRAISALASERILVREDEARISYFPDTQWSDALPKLVQARLTQAFENSSRIRAVGQNGDGLKADYILVTEIRRFEYAPSEGAVVSIFVKIVNDRNGRVVSSRLFEAAEQSAGEDPSEVVAAIDRAFGSVQTDIVSHTLRRI